MLFRLRRVAIALVLGPLLTLGIYAIASAGEDPASQARDVLTALESKQAAPALSGNAASAVDGGTSDGSTEASAPPAPTSSPLLAAQRPIDEAHKALDRAKELRAAGDVAHAELAEDAALEWALTARELVASVETERAADDLGNKAIESTSKADRARALLEESITRRGRLQQTLDDLDQELASRALDAGADAKDAPPPKTKPKAGGKP